MSETRVLDAALIKDLLNHIYEKRKATAFKIEGLTKAALAQNDTARIHLIIKVLSDLTNAGLTSGRMGAITALGSVSVALGLLTIAYFLEDIVLPIFGTFRDTDARVRYYACESLYNIAKIARGEILLYFNEVFDILCVLVTDTELSVKNAADILDRLIKDIVSAKATSYVLVLHQQNEEPPDVSLHVTMPNGMVLQINHPQDPLKAFSLPRFIPTLLERMYTIEPFAKKFLLSWLELFDDIPQLELITFLPYFLEPLFKFLMNNCPSDVRIETQNLLNVFLKEAKTIARIKADLRRRKREEPEQETSDAASVKSNSTTIIHTTNNNTTTRSDLDSSIFVSGQDIFIDYPKIIEILLMFLSPGPDSKVNLATEPHEVCLEIQATALKWLQEVLSISPASFLRFIPECVSVIMRNLAITDDHNDIDLRNQFLAFDRDLQSYLLVLQRQLGSNPPPESESLDTDAYDEFVELYLLKTAQVVLSECSLCVNELARLTSLDWLKFLYLNYRSSVFSSAPDLPDGSSLDLTGLLRSSVDASNDVISKVLSLAAQISEESPEFFQTFIQKLVAFFEAEGPDDSTHGVLSRQKVEFIVKRLCVLISSELIFRSISEVLKGYETRNPVFVGNTVVTLNNILLTSPELQGLRKKLKALDTLEPEDYAFFSALFQTWCHNAPSALSLCLITSNYELSYRLITELADSEMTFQLLSQIDILVQLLESHIFMKLRLQLLEPEKYPFLYKSLYGILMIMPQSSTYTTLWNRLSSISALQYVPSQRENETSSLSSDSKTVELAEMFAKVHEIRELTEVKRLQKVHHKSFPSSESKALMPDYFAPELRDAPTKSK